MLCTFNKMKTDLFGGISFYKDFEDKDVVLVVASPDSLNSGVWWSCVKIPWLTCHPRCIKNFPFYKKIHPMEFIRCEMSISRLLNKIQTYCFIDLLTRGNVFVRKINHSRHSLTANLFVMTCQMSKCFVIFHFIFEYIKIHQCTGYFISICISLFILII